MSSRGLPDHEMLASLRLVAESLDALGLGDAIATLRAASEPGEAGAKAGGDGADVR